MTTVLRWELARLAGMLRTRLTAAVCLLAPFAAVLALSATSQVPKDTLFGRWLHTTGFALPLVVLGFATTWAFPLLAAVVGGDVFAAENEAGTWPVLLTRGRSRAQVFAGKALAAIAFSVTMTVLLAASSLVAGLLWEGSAPLPSVTGALLGSGAATGAVLLAWTWVLLPVVAFTCLAVLLSVTNRRGAVGVAGPVVLGLLMQLLGLVGSGPWRDLLLTTPFEAWHGIVAAPRFTGPLVRGTATSLVWAVGSIGAAAVLFARREFTGG